MTQLSSNARALIEASRKSLRPTAADRARVEAALQARLNEAAAPGQAETAAMRGGLWKVGAGLALGACIVGAALVRGVSAPPRPAVERPTIVASAASDSPASLAAEASGTAASGAPENRAHSPSMSARARPPLPLSAAGTRTHNDDQLALEVKLLSQATRALRAGHAAQALKALAEHQRQFPNGALRQERNVARAQALCGMRRLAEGRAELEQVPRDAPGAAAARKSCNP